ncbi:MAG TPA: DNA mismatch repair endonuclease MutL, partial [Victivallales bacterium]|nr:DNA mismatch repair endonuclease MutL [Victivallales bacterium]
MANKIIILPDPIINKIAAGEVIERPASVLKELIENSLDAQSNRINIIVDGAGVKFISVTDNGCGMSADDALLCIEPHATSKITAAEDLNTIQTFGFRGEALPSIASVSKFRLRTRTHDSKEGTEIFVNGGKLIESKPTGCPEGTEVTVRELFFNVPARRKFLSSPQVEEKHILELLYTIGIANFTVYFEYHSNGKLIFSSLASNDLKSRITEFFGRTYFQNLIPVEYEEEGIEVQGFTAKHGFYRTSRREQRIYINKRPAESNVIFAGIKDAYYSLLPQGKYPPVILFIKTNPVRVDVNVHPAKREVKFREPLLFRKVVEKALRESLRISQSPAISINTPLPLKQLLDASSISYIPKDERIQTKDSFLPDFHKIP